MIRRRIPRWPRLRSSRRNRRIAASWRTPNRSRRCRCRWRRPKPCARRWPAPAALGASEEIVQPLFERAALAFTHPDSKSIELLETLNQENPSPEVALAIAQAWLRADDAPKAWKAAEVRCQPRTGDGRDAHIAWHLRVETRAERNRAGRISPGEPFRSAQCAAACLGGQTPGGDGPPRRSDSRTARCHQPCPRRRRVAI